MPDPGAFLVGAIAVSLATPVLGASLGRPPVEAPVSPGAVALAGMWWLGFLTATVMAAMQSGNLAVVGLFLAAAELAGAATIWFARSLPGRGGGGGGGGGGGQDGGGDLSPPAPSDAAPGSRPRRRVRAVGRRPGCRAPAPARLR